MKLKLPLKELVLSQVFTLVFIFLSWLFLGAVFGRVMGLIYSLHILEQLPLILIYGLIFFYNIDLLTPNPKSNTELLQPVKNFLDLLKSSEVISWVLDLVRFRPKSKGQEEKELAAKLFSRVFSGVDFYKVFGVMVTEAFEHLFLYLGVLLISLVAPSVWYLFIVAYTYLVFGLVLGEIKTFKEVLQLLLMSFIFTLVLFIPDFLKVLLVHHGIGFQTSLPLFLIVPFCLYLLFKSAPSFFKKDKEIPSTKD